MSGCLDSVIYLPNGACIVTGSRDGTIRIWDADSGAVVGDLMGHNGHVASVIYSPDGQHIISGSHDCTVRIWDVKTGAVVGIPLEGHTSLVTSVAYSPDGCHIISGSVDCTIQIWDAKTGTGVGNPLDGHTSLVQFVDYPPNGRHNSSGSDNSTIRTRDADADADAAAGKPLGEHPYSVQPIAYSSDRNGSYDNTTHVLDPFPYASIRTSSRNPIHPNFCAKPDKYGWVKDSEGGLLYWVPHDCRDGLHSPAVLTIPLTSRHRSVSPDFEGFAFGTSWSQNFKSTPS